MKEPHARLLKPSCKGHLRRACQVCLEHNGIAHCGKRLLAGHGDGFFNQRLLYADAHIAIDQFNEVLSLHWPTAPEQVR